MCQADVTFSFLSEPLMCGGFRDEVGLCLLCTSSLCCVLSCAFVTGSREQVFILFQNRRGTTVFFRGSAKCFQVGGVSCDEPHNFITTFSDDDRPVDP